METCFTNRPRFENVAASARRAPTMHRLCGALTLALLIGSGGGCADSSRAQRVAALQEFHGILRNQWQTDIAIERTEVDQKIGDMRQDVVTLTQKAVEVERWKTKDAEPALGRLEELAAAMARLKYGLPGDGSVLSYLQGKFKKNKADLSFQFDKNASGLNKTSTETAARLDALERGLAESARAKLKEEIAATGRQLRTERQGAIDKLQREISDTKTLATSVEKLVVGRFAGIETREQYLWPIILGIVALALVNMFIALRPRYSKQAAEALGKAETAQDDAQKAMSAARQAQDTAESIKEEDSLGKIPPRRPRRTKKQPKSKNAEQSPASAAVLPPAPVDDDRKPIDPGG